MNYKLSYPAVNGEVVTEGHATYCAENGHATHTRDGVTSNICPRCGANKVVAAKKGVYAATYNGKTVTRKSNKAYTHASLVKWSNGEVEIASFHTSEVAALKGVLTAQQKKNGAAVIATVPVTQI